jgi:hypothetical protein
LAQLSTAVLGLLIILLAALLAVAGATLAHNRVPVELRKSHTVPLGLINGGLNVMFGVIVGFSRSASRYSPNTSIPRSSVNRT